MIRALTSTAFALGAIFVMAACGGAVVYGTPSTPLSGQTPGGSGPPTGPSGTPPATISMETSSLGKILVDGSGRPVYLFEADHGTTSTCYDACAAVWPPVLTGSAPQAGPGVNQALLATTARSDGTLEVLCNGHPLYYFVSDKSGQATGQGLSSFGADWYVLSPAGDKVDNG